MQKTYGIKSVSIGDAHLANIEPINITECTPHNLGDGFVIEGINLSPSMLNLMFIGTPKRKNITTKLTSKNYARPVFLKENVPANLTRKWILSYQNFVKECYK